jgi:hypothetical protein
MTASLQALIRAIDALQHHEPEVEGPQGATENIPVAPDNLLEKQARGHTSHRGHSQTIDHGEKQRQEVRKASDRVHAGNGSPPKIYLPTVAPVAHVALGLDSKGENRGHTAKSCGPLWPPPGFPRVSEPAGVPDDRRRRGRGGVIINVHVHKNGCARGRNAKSGATSPGVTREENTPSEVTPNCPRHAPLVRVRGGNVDGEFRRGCG